MKKLAKSFVASRVCDVVVLPSWDVKPVFGKTFLQLNMQMSKLKSVKEELSCLFSTDSRNLMSIMYEEENNSAQNKDYEVIALQNPGLILHIDLSLNDITTLGLADLAPFLQLRSLDVSFNCIDDFSGIAACTQLTSLKLSYNNVKNLPLTALEECKHLVHLDLCSNKISNLLHFPVLPNLRTINLGHNKLKNVDGLHVLPLLKEIHLQSNKIDNIVGISACMALEKVDLSHNCLERAVDVVDIFTHIHGMKQLKLVGNPGKLDEYLMYLLAKTTSISIVDGVHVGPLRLNFAGIDKVAPPTNHDSLKLELKQAVEEAMEKSSSSEKGVYEKQLSYLHSKIVALNAEHQQYMARNENNLELWFRYIEGLSEQEAQSLSISNLQALPWNSTTMDKVEEEVKSREKRKKKEKLPHVPTDTTVLLTTAANVLRQSLQ